MNSKNWLILLVGIILGFSAATATQGLLDAYVRSASKRTAGDAIQISKALEAYRHAHGSYPPLDGNVEHLSQYLVPTYLRAVPTRDTTGGRPFMVVMNGSHASVISVGRYGLVVEGEEIQGAAPWIRR